MIEPRKKLIEVAMPLSRLNPLLGREKSIRHGHPSTLHLWWGRVPLAAARVVIFAQMVDDPGSCPEEFPTEDDQHQERQRLHDLMVQLADWSIVSGKYRHTHGHRVLTEAREEIMRSWRRTCADHAMDPDDDPPAFPMFREAGIDV